MSVHINPITDRVLEDGPVWTKTNDAIRFDAVRRTSIGDDIQESVDIQVGRTLAIDGGRYIAESSQEFLNLPVELVAPPAGSFEAVAGSPGIDLIINGSGTAKVTLGIAIDSDGQRLNSSGSTYQVAEDYSGPVIINLEDARVDGVHQVDFSIQTETGTIADNAPPGQNPFDYYTHSGAGNDQAVGSIGRDFIRLGAGNDSFQAGPGNDLVRTGSGDDSGSLGPGDDVVYFTVDQLQGAQRKTLTDFDGDGDDMIQIEASLESRVDIDCSNDGQSIIIRLSGRETGTTEVISEAGTIDADDIEFR